MNVWFEYEGLHIVEVFTMKDLDSWMSSERNQENRRMIIYWIRLMNEKAGEPLAMWDDTVFLYAIEFQWFLQDLQASFI